MPNQAPKIKAIVSVNEGAEWLVLEEPILFVYHEEGRNLIGQCGPFRNFLDYGGSSRSMRAFGGAELSLTMEDGSVRRVKDNWWSSCRNGYVSIGVKGFDELGECYVFGSANIHTDDMVTLRDTYSGPVYPYRDYECIACYSKLRTKYSQAVYLHSIEKNKLIAEAKSWAARAKKLEMEASS